MSTVRRGLWWTLAGVGAISAWSVVKMPLAGGAQGSVVEPIVREHSTSGAVGATDSPVTALPATVDREVVTVAERDPFADIANPPAPSVAPATPVVKPFVGPPLPPPPPPMTHRFFGAMRTPEGSMLVYLTDSDEQAPAKVGQALRSGYVVEAVTEREIKLVYPPLDHHTSVPVPPDSRL